jgi:hypothetical protein
VRRATFSPGSDDLSTQLILPIAMIDECNGDDEEGIIVHD